MSPGDLTSAVEPRDAAARQRIESDLTSSLLVEAAAGTGKTTVLVRRLVEVLAADPGTSENPGPGTTVDRIVAVTFTNKAAGELKLRLRQELDRARAAADGDRRRRLSAAIARLEEATIGTIHSLCAEILRRRPVEAGIDPAFAEVDENQAAALYNAAYQGWIEEQLEDPPEGLARALSRQAGWSSFDGRTPLERVREAGRQRLEWRDYPHPWRRRPFSREGALAQTMEQVAGLAEMYSDNDDTRDPLRQAIAPAWRLHEWYRLSRELAGGEAPPGDENALEARVLETLRELRRSERKKGRGSWPKSGISRAEVLRRRDQLIATMDSFKMAADADLAVLLRAELDEVVQRYGALKARHGQLDFLDLLVRTRDLLRDCEPVRRHLQESFTHVFVDEFQDTDPLQVEIIFLLAAASADVVDWQQACPAPGKLFLVGDPKQSIYRFRRADVLLYQRVKELLSGWGVDTEVLSHSWRATEPIQRAVNAAFARDMVEDNECGQPAYVALEGEVPARNDASVVALPIGSPYNDWGRITQWKLEQQQPATVAAWIEWLLNESGWQVRDPEDPTTLVDVRAQHVAVLFRRFLSWQQDVTRPYLAELEARGIPHLLAGGRSFHQREEVETVRAALSAVEWPHDELSVFATLKGGLFAIDDGSLLRFHDAARHLNPFGRRPDELDLDLQPVLDALDLLADLHRRRNRVPVARTLERLLRHTRAHAGFAMRPAGNQVLSNVQRVIDLARTFDLRGGLSFRGFVQRLGAEAERPGSTETPLTEEGAEGVRLMTVHGVKGLEFPIVILADITAQLSRRDPGSFVDPGRGLCATKILGCAPWELVENAEPERVRDRAEGVRLAYVAATRARDVLVVPTIGEFPWEDGWTSPLNGALYPARERYRRSHPAAGCPPFGDSSVIDRPQQAHGETEASVKPGRHRAEAGNDVVWWDPRLLRTDVPPNFGLRQESLLSDADADAVARGAADYRAWEQSRAQLLATGSRPTENVVLVSETDEEPPSPTVPPTLAMTQRDADRPTGRRFGTLVHTVLRDVDFGADEAAVRALAAFHGRVLGVPQAEVDAGVDAVRRALDHELVRAAIAAPERYREHPVTLRLDDGRVVEGVVDLLYRDGEGWVVVDFKTDANVDTLTERYGNQAGWYAHAISALVQAPVRTCLLVV